MKRTKKGSRIYWATYAECKHHLRVWGDERNPDGRLVGFNRLNTEEPVSERTLNSVQAEIDWYCGFFKKCEEMGIQDDYSERMKVLEMVQVTLENARKRLAKEV